MSYRATLNGETFYLSETNESAFKLLSADLSLSAGSAGSFTFTMAPDNKAYSDITKLTSYIDVYRDEQIIFSGRVIDESVDFQNCKLVTCEGLLAILNDSVYRPINFNGTLQELCEKIIESHNEQMEDNPEKIITIGNITVGDDYLYRPYENVDKSMNRFLDLVDSYGGYMSLNRAEGKLYFNWKADIDIDGNQSIDFGSNLLDITRESHAAEIISVLVPLGAQIEDEITGQKSRINICDVNEGKDYIEDEDAIEEFGRVVGVCTWDDINTAADLKRKGEEYLAEKNFSKVTINVTAVDLAGTEQNVGNFTIGTNVKVTSEAHGIVDEWFAIKNQNINLLNPANDSMTLGDERRGYISKNRSQYSAQTKRINKTVQEYAESTKVAELTQRVTENSTSIEQNAQEIRTHAQYIESINGTLNSHGTQLVQNAEGIEALVTENNRIATAFRVDAEGVHIGRQDDEVSSLQDGRSYKFIKGNNKNNPLLEINTEGINAPTVEATEQIALSEGSTKQWAFRLGQAVNGRHNLNDVWIGG